jgi:hypothetical protein
VQTISLTRSVSVLAGGVGVATQAYWRLLLVQVKPLPRFFSQIGFPVAAAVAKVSVQRSWCQTDHSISFSGQAKLPTVCQQ